MSWLSPWSLTVRNAQLQATISSDDRLRWCLHAVREVFQPGVVSTCMKGIGSHLYCAGSRRLCARGGRHALVRSIGRAVDKIIRSAERGYQGYGLQAR